MPHLIVFSHLRWNFVFQRPQHLLSRLAAHYNVVFIEEPTKCDGPAHFERSSPCAGVEVLRPCTPVEAGGFHDDQLATLQRLVPAYLANAGIDDYFVWFYTPMALPLLSELTPRAVIYDCMDELAAFKNAPRQMRQREAALLKSADLVLTGGPRLFEAKRHLNDNVLCVPSAVDAAHYDPVRAAADTAAMERANRLQAQVPRPRLGFFGVIDERLDLQLIAQLAQARADWHVVMVGPVVKIDPATLPQRANLHWLGQQPYELLPQLVAGWDVCLMPFALNEATAYISPTKTLEYMAADKPIVSTAIHDVKAMFADVVAIADGREAFIGACRAALDESVARSLARRAATLSSVLRYSWARTAEVVHRSLEELLVGSDRQQPAVLSDAMLLDARRPRQSKMISAA